MEIRVGVWKGVSVRAYPLSEPGEISNPESMTSAFELGLWSVFLFFFLFCFFLKERGTRSEGCLSLFDTENGEECNASFSIQQLLRSALFIHFCRLVLQKDCLAGLNGRPRAG